MPTTPYQLRSTFDEIQLGIAHTGLDGRFLLANQWLCLLLGYSEQELKALHFAAISHPEDVPQDLEALNALIAGFIPRYIREKRYRRADGSFVWANLRVSLHRDAAGWPVYFIAIIEDLTERKQIEQQLRQAHKMEAIGRLAGGIAHDFKNLLTAIDGYADLALEQLDLRETAVRHDIEEIRVAGRTAASLTRQLLAFSRRQHLEPQIVDLNTVLERTAGLLERLIGAPIKMIWRLGNPLDRVCADVTQLEQVVLNLALNARDAMPDGGILTIETANVELDTAYAEKHPGVSPGAHVMLALSDTGVGIDAGAWEHLFEPFYTTKPPGHGTGLGLAAVYGIVRQSGGSIVVDSGPGRGTTFTVYLPRDERTIQVPDAEPVPTIDLHGTETILLVEDQPQVRAVVHEVLAQYGYIVLEAPDGAAALELATSAPSPVHLLLTDIVMPGMSGPVLAERVREVRPLTKVLFMSGYARDGEDRKAVRDLDAAVFIQKPFAPKSLLAKLREMLA